MELRLRSLQLTGPSSGVSSSNKTILLSRYTVYNQTRSLSVCGKSFAHHVLGGGIVVEDPAVDNQCI